VNIIRDFCPCKASQPPLKDARNTLNAPHIAPMRASTQAPSSGYHLNGSQIFSANNAYIPITGMMNESPQTLQNSKNAASSPGLFTSRTHTGIHLDHFPQPIQLNQKTTTTQKDPNRYLYPPFPITSSPDDQPTQNVSSSQTPSSFQPQNESSQYSADYSQTAVSLSNQPLNNPLSANEVSVLRDSHKNAAQKASSSSVFGSAFPPPSSNPLDPKPNLYGMSAQELDNVIGIVIREPEFLSLVRLLL